MENIKASVIITSYNHANSIARAIDSVLSQKTTFNFYIVVIDDGSNDGSKEILKEYYNNKSIQNLSVISFENNQGLMQAYKVGFECCIGEYIAVCDCDDRWCDEFKLQKQVDYMEAHPECGMCHTNAYSETFGVDGLREMNYPLGATYETMLKGNSYICATTMCFRRNFMDFDRILKKKFYVWDYPILLHMIRRCKFHKLNDFTAINVVHGESVTHTKKRMPRLRYVLGIFRIKSYYIVRYGCKLDTMLYVIYKLTRDILSIILKRWYK